ncbi:MAG: GbsR/MarR family transcriptional regulator [Anaerolineales bacterium]|jgi:DNA-binding transcriptional regulator GbsR (MarR family)
MNEKLTQAHENFIQGISRITNFWGFPKAMGAIYGAIYLSPAPLTLDGLVEQVGVTKGAVSTNVRMLERLGMIHKHVVIGDRKDYYTAEIDFWKVAKGILQEREKSEFDTALRSVSDSLDMVQTAEIGPEETEIAAFYEQRMETMQSFFKTLDNIVATALALEELRLSTIGRLFSNKAEE